MPFTAGQRAQAATFNANMPQLIGSTILTGPAAAITIGIPTGFNHLQAVWSARSDAAAGAVSINLRLNGDSGNNYVWQNSQANNTSAGGADGGGATSLLQVGSAPGASGTTANYFGTGNFSAANIASAVFKPVSGTSIAATTATNTYSGSYGGMWLSTAVITAVTLLANSGNLIAASSLSIYGWG